MISRGYQMPHDALQQKRLYFTNKDTLQLAEAEPTTGRRLYCLMPST